MEYIPKLEHINYRFDFEIGHLIKSPCRECQIKMNFPGCEETCITLNRIQAILSEGISSIRRI
ncbi:MAG: hypothetical protein EHM30_05120 [Desulfobacteraceae bacterium]|nr:MAG: hypothetical protein EHM30_05120 [Desulfobacteraceae bacterium]